MNIRIKIMPEEAEAILATLPAGKERYVKLVEDFLKSYNGEDQPIIAPASVPTELVETCLNALQRCRDGYVITGEPRKLLDKSISLCNRHLSGEKPEPVSKPHNPDGLTDLGQSDGWRLLDEDEIKPRYSSSVQIEKWEFPQWNNQSWRADCPRYTYRTRLSRADLAAISKGEKK